jgi:hypothetical protein
MKKLKFSSAGLLILLLVSMGSVTIALGQPTAESRSARIIDVAEGASEKVGELIELIYANETALEKIELEGLTLAFEGNVSLYYEGVEKVEVANSLRELGDFEDATGNATEAMAIFREVYKSIHLILWKSEVRLDKDVDIEELEEAILRSQEKVDELKELISEDTSIYEKLVEAENYLIEAFEFLSDNIEESISSLRQASILINEISLYLKELAQDLNSQRIWDYCEGAYQYRERFRERFGQAWDEGFDVNGFLESFGYTNEEDFLNQFWEMIQNAQKSSEVEDVFEDLEEIGRIIRDIDDSFNQEMGRHRAQHGQSGVSYGGEENTNNNGQQDFGGNIFGQMGSSNKGSSGSGQMRYGANK